MTTETNETNEQKKRTHGPRRSYAERMAEVRASAKRRLAKLQESRAKKLAEVEAVDAEIARVKAEIGEDEQTSLDL